MKTTIVRLSVLALAFTGFTASSLVSSAQSSKHIAVGQTSSVVPANCRTPSTCNID